MDLFVRAAEDDARRAAPLADRMRPRTVDEVVGQEHLTAPGALLRSAIDRGQLPSLILWGPPGSGKTTLAHVLAASVEARFVALSAVLSGVKELRELVAEARDAFVERRARTILFIDEIHRFNRAQQDALLPHVEHGTVTLIGATTENPSFEVTAALLSRARVVTLRALAPESIVALLRRALHDPRGLDGKVAATDDALERLAEASCGDARRALTALEVATQSGAAVVDQKVVEEALASKTLLYDKAGDEHYGVVSAFIKSMRGSDPDAAVYWMTRMLEAGEEPRFILRRMIIFASEDVGNADPQALAVACDALRAFELVGLPEGVLPLTQAAIYLSLAPKSNTALTAYASARAAVREHGALPVPSHLRNATTPLDVRLGRGQGYRYPHDFEGHYVPERYLPDRLKDAELVKLSENGRERELSERLAELRARAPR